MADSLKEKRGLIIVSEIGFFYFIHKQWLTFVNTLCVTDL